MAVNSIWFVAYVNSTDTLVRFDLSDGSLDSSLNTTLSTLTGEAVTSAEIDPLGSTTKAAIAFDSPSAGKDVVGILNVGNDGVSIASSGTADFGSYELDFDIIPPEFSFAGEEAGLFVEQGGTQQVYYTKFGATSVVVSSPGSGTNAYVRMSPSGGVSINHSNSDGVLTGVDTETGSQLWQITLPNGQTSTRSFDDSGWLIVGLPGEEKLLFPEHYSFVFTGNLLVVDFADGTLSTYTGWGINLASDAFYFVAYNSNTGEAVVRFQNDVYLFSASGTAQLLSVPFSYPVGQYDPVSEQWYFVSQRDASGFLLSNFTVFVCSEDFSQVQTISLFPGGINLQQNEFVAFGGPVVTATPDPFWVAFNKTTEVIE